jgi:PTH1 family peptidyl-tRNA hydrolase
MKLVIGLGNPGVEYAQTRHNTGFHVVEKLAEKLGWSWNERRSRSMLASGTLGLEKVILVKPLTYMNRSGEAVGELARWYRVQPEDILVVHDDLDLPVGKLRLRSNGSAGGHNGVDNIILHLHTDQFPRLRIGIGRPANKHMETISYVLSIPPADERILLETAEDRAVEVIPLILSRGVALMMNYVNADPEALRKAEERRKEQMVKREQRAQERQQRHNQETNQQDSQQE